LHRFWDLAFNTLKSPYSAIPVAFDAPTEGFPWDDLRKFLPGCQRMAKVPNGIEILPKISTGWVGRTNVTDIRQPDRRIYDDAKKRSELDIATCKDNLHVT